MRLPSRSVSIEAVKGVFMDHLSTGTTGDAHRSERVLLVKG